MFRVPLRFTLHKTLLKRRVADLLNLRGLAQVRAVGKQGRRSLCFHILSCLNVNFPESCSRNHTEVLMALPCPITTQLWGYHSIGGCSCTIHDPCQQTKQPKHLFFKTCDHIFHFRARKFCELLVVNFCGDKRSMQTNQKTKTPLPENCSRATVDVLVITSCLWSTSANLVTPQVLFLQRSTVQTAVG